MMRTNETSYTIDGLPARVHHVVFKCQDIPGYDTGEFQSRSTSFSYGERSSDAVIRQDSLSRKNGRRVRR